MGDNIQWDHQMGILDKDTIKWNVDQITKSPKDLLIGNMDCRGRKFPPTLACIMGFGCSSKALLRGHPSSLERMINFH